jgi:hypothetical protein
MGSSVFIGPSHKKIKFFTFFCRKNNKVYCWFYNAENSVLSREKRIFQTVRLLDGDKL